MWKGSVQGCRDHFNEKHSGSETLDFDKVSKSFPAWTVTRDFWERALKPEISGIAVDIQLFHESRRRLVHKYRVYQDPLPHPALREGRITRLISLVNRAMVITKLTQLRIAIPSSGNAPGEVPSDCFPKMDELGSIKMTKRVSFAPDWQTASEEVNPMIANQDETSTVEPTGTIQQETDEPRTQDVREESPVPPPGFRPFEWPQAEWADSGEVTLDPGLKFVASWSGKISEEEMSSPPPLEPMSPIPGEISQDSIMVQVGTTDSEAYTPIVLDRIRSVHRRRSRRPMKTPHTCEKPAPTEDFLFKDILCEEALIANRSLLKTTGMVTAAGCLGGAWPGRDHSQTNVLRPLFESWGRAVLSDIRRTVQRTTPLRRAGSESR